MCGPVLISSKKHLATLAFTCCNVLQRVAACCTVSQCVAVILRCDSVSISGRKHLGGHATRHDDSTLEYLLHITERYKTLQDTTTHYNTLQHTATYCNILQHTATHCNPQQHTATHCNALQQETPRSSRDFAY